MKVEEAQKKKCPIARTFADGKGPNCMAGDCILWRWFPLSAKDPEFMAAVRAEIGHLAEAEGKKPNVSFHKKAVAYVMENKEALGLHTSPHSGYCGLGGAPEQ